MDQDNMPMCLHGDCKGLGCAIYGWCNQEERSLYDIALENIHRNYEWCRRFSPLPTYEFRIVAFPPAILRRVELDEECDRVLVQALHDSGFTPDRKGRSEMEWKWTPDRPFKMKYPIELTYVPRRKR